MANSLPFGPDFCQGLSRGAFYEAYQDRAGCEHAQLASWWQSDDWRRGPKLRADPPTDEVANLGVAILTAKMIQPRVDLKP